MSEQDIVEQLLEKLAQQDADARLAFLSAVGQLDPSLRATLEARLASAGEAGSSEVERTTTSEAAWTLTRSPVGPLEPPERIGPYTIIREIGSGGMGVVYEAEQITPIRLRLALKVVKFGMDTRQVVARFETERQALALMNHPNIARVFDAGATEEGRPYFAMEYVQGIPITDYCDKHRLALLERLSLFIEVCEGVQHAHQKGIIHRDIKPSNVLVTIRASTPVAKIIDFGVAKATSLRLTEQKVYTAFGQMIGTPEYMSPEQAEMTNLDIDTRTDVYSLGVVLYELLVGARPFDSEVLRQASFDEMRRIVREVEPPRPSTKARGLNQESSAVKDRRSTPAGLRRELVGDLDWITMKALEKDRTRRYSSPAELASDIRRFLRHEPVIASPPSQLYRMHKFVQRHRAGVLAAISAFVLLAGFALTMAIQSARIAEERDRSESEAAKAIAINEFLRETLSSANPYEGEGREVTVLEALSNAEGNIEYAFRDQPEIRSAVQRTIGATYLALGHFEDAKRLLQSSLELIEANLPRDHPGHLESLNALAELHLELGDYEDAETMYREARAIGGESPGQLPPGIVTTLNGLGKTLQLQGDPDEAEKCYREALALGRELHGDEHPDVATSLNNLAALENGRGERDKAEELYRQVLHMYEKLLGAEHPLVIQSLNNLAVVLTQKGDYDAAEPLMRRALELSRRVFGDDHPSVATLLNNLGNLARNRGALETAEPLLREALGLDRKLFGDLHPNVAIDLSDLARVLCAQEAGQEPYELFDEAIEIYETTLEPDHWRLAQTRTYYGRCLTKYGRYPEAETMLTAAHEALQAKLGGRHEYTLEAILALVELYESWSKPVQAAAYRALLRGSGLVDEGGSSD